MARIRCESCPYFDLLAAIPSTTSTWQPSLRCTIPPVKPLPIAVSSSAEKIADHTCAYIFTWANCPTYLAEFPENLRCILNDWLIRPEALPIDRSPFRYLVQYEYVRPPPPTFRVLMPHHMHSYPCALYRATCDRSPGVPTLMNSHTSLRLINALCTSETGYRTEKSSLSKCEFAFLLSSTEAGSFQSYDNVTMSSCALHNTGKAASVSSKMPWPNLDAWN